MGGIVTIPFEGPRTMTSETQLARKDHSRKAGVYLIVWGVLAFCGLYGIPLILLGMGILRRSERCRAWAVCYLLILIGFTTVSVVAAFETVPDLTWSVFLLWCLAVVIAFPPLIWLEAPGTRAAFRDTQVQTLGGITITEDTAPSDPMDPAARLAMKQEIRNRQGSIDFP